MIQISNLSYGYNKQKPVLSHINLKLKKGVIYGLLGKNAEGKTTLMNIMSGMLFPDKGSCTVLGEDSSKRTVNLLQQIYFLSEKNILPDVRLSDYLKMYAPFYPCYSNRIQKECIAYFGLDTSVFLNKISEGQKKKAAITMALSANTPILFMDEPTNGLDTPSKDAFRKLLALSATEDRMIVMSTHQIRELENLLDTVIILEDKKIVLNNTMEEISKKILFKRMEINEQALYSEIFPTGKIGIMKNETGVSGFVSLELLLNMVTKNKELVKSLLDE